MEEYTETLGPFIAVSVKLLIKPTGSNCQSTGCTRTEKWPFFFCDQNIEMWGWSVSKDTEMFQFSTTGAKVERRKNFPAQKELGSSSCPLLETTNFSFPAELVTPARQQRWGRSTLSLSLDAFFSGKFMTLINAAPKYSSGPLVH